MAANFSTRHGTKSTQLTNAGVIKSQMTFNGSNIVFSISLLSNATHHAGTNFLVPVAFSTLRMCLTTHNNGAHRSKATQTIRKHSKTHVTNITFKNIWILLAVSRFTRVKFYLPQRTPSQDENCHIISRFRVDADCTFAHYHIVDFPCLFRTYLFSTFVRMYPR